MVLFKVVLHGNPTRKAVSADTLDDVIAKSLAKFNINDGQYKIVLEEDGTEIDDDVILLELAKATTVPIVLLLLPQGLSYDSAKSSETSQTSTATELPKTIAAPSCSSSLEDIVSDRNLWSTFSPSLMETVEKKLRATHTQRLDLIKNIVTYMFESRHDTSRTTAVAICETICNMYPESFQDSLDCGRIIGRGYESLLGQLVGAINYRKVRLNKKRILSQEDNIDEDDDIGQNCNLRKSTSRKEDEYGCVEYNPLLPPEETEVTQEQKRNELVQFYTSKRAKVDEEVTKLMKETYPSQRASIIECSQKKGLTQKFFDQWPYLKNSNLLLNHASRLLGKDVVEQWTSTLATKAPSIRSLMKMISMEKILQAKKKQDELSDTFFMDTLKESKKQARQVVRGDIPLNTAVFPLIVHYFNEDQGYFYVVVEDSLTEEAIRNKLPNAGPTLLIRGSSIYDETATYSVILEKQFEIPVADILQAFLLTFLSYYIFGCCYPSKLNCTLEFIQRALLLINPTGGKKNQSKKRKHTSFDLKVLKLINMLKD